MSASERGVIAILGAGCAGLAAGLRLAKRGYRVVLIEEADHVGGLAGGVHINGNVYEYGPHTFHTTDPEILHDIKSLMGNDLIPYRRTIKIKFLGNYFQFPLAMRDVLFKLPLPTVLHAGASFVWHFARGMFVKPAVENSETLLQRYYGDVLYEIFFKSYILRVWGIPPSEFSPAFARERIPRLNLLDLLDKISTAVKNRLGRRVSTESFVEKVEGNLYTTRQGFSLITQRMGDKVIELGGEILLDAEVKRLIREDRRVSAVEYSQNGATRRLTCAGVINTLPINEAIKMTEPAWDGSVLQSANALRFRALVFVGLVVRRPHVLPSSFMYFREHSFNRISDLAQFGFHITPDGSTLLVAEISCDVTERYWTDEEYAKEAVIADLARENLVNRDEIVETHVFRSEHAYPIYTLHYERHRDTLLAAIGATANMETAGRQGRFQYINTHIAIKMGYEAADRLMAKLETEK
jgi:protoporphyrinogen oxidase